VTDRTDLTPAADDDGGAGDQPAGDQAARSQPAGEAAGSQAARGQPAGEVPPGSGAERWLDPAEMKAWLAFLEVSHLLERAIEQQLRQDAGLSHAQYEILSRLEAADGGALRMSELADVIVVSRSGLTYQITQLEKEGLVSSVAKGGVLTYQGMTYGDEDRYGRLPESLLSSARESTDEFVKQSGNPARLKRDLDAFVLDLVKIDSPIPFDS